MNGADQTPILDLFLLALFCWVCYGALQLGVWRKALRRARSDAMLSGRHPARGSHK